MQSSQRTATPLTSRITDSQSLLMPASRRADWLAAAKAGNLEAKQKIAEELGEEATRNVAKSRGHAPLFAESELPHHGPDFPTIDSGGRVHLYEAKGGSSKIKVSYGYPQGTPENGVQYYKKLIDSQSATPKQKVIAQFIMDKASEGKVDAHVVRLEPVQGEPRTMQIIDRDCNKQAEKLAKDFIRERNLAKTVVGKAALPAEKSPTALHGGAKATEDASSAAKSAGKIGKMAAKIGEHAGPIGVAVEVGIRGYSVYEAESEYQAGNISANERGERHAENIGGCVGGTGGAAAGAAAGAIIGAPFGGIGAIPGAVIGGVIGCIGGGIAGDWMGSTAGREIYRTVR